MLSTLKGSSKPPSNPPTPPKQASKPKTPTKPASWVWDHVKEENLQCKYCTDKFSTSTATTTIARHLLHKHGKAPAEDPKQRHLATPISAAEKRATDEKCVRWIVEDGRPFNVVESPAFREFITFANPGYEPPCRQTVANIIDRTAPETKESIKDILANAVTKITLTTDAWTSRAKDAFVVTTAHFLDDAWTFRKLVIAFEYQPEAHDIPALTARLLKVIHEYGIERKIGGIVTDNAGNARGAAVEVAKELSKYGTEVLAIRCMNHILQLIVNEGCKKSKAAIETLKSAVAHFNRSSQDLVKLHQFCEGYGEKKLVPQQDMVVRWNSTLIMIKSMSPMKRSIAACDIKITKEEWAQLDKLAEVLGPFEEASVMLQSSSAPTLASVEFILETLRRGLSEANADDVLNVADMFAKITKYECDVKKAAHLSTFFDPRFLRYLTPADFRKTAEAAKGLLPKQDAALEPKQNAPLDFWDREYDDQMGRETEKVTGHPELDKYISHVSSLKLKLKDDPLAWWKANEGSYPTVSRLARDKLALLATSAASEQAFSSAGHVVSELRCSLETSTITNLMVMQGLLRYERVLSNEQNPLKRKAPDS